MHAQRILRIDTLAVPDKRRYVKVGSEMAYYGDDDDEGTMLWLWRHHPVIWFTAL
jgi:hypothetical protein